MPNEIAETRRNFLAKAAGIAAAGAAGIYATGTATAQPSGEFPASTEDPLRIVYADRHRWYPRTSDPSAPDDGVSWYRGDL